MSAGKESCNASARCLIAIAEARLGHPESSREHIRLARAIVESFTGSYDGESKPSRPYWYDWSVASLLIRQAEQELEP